MGMDLKPIKPNKNAPKKEGKIIWNRYNCWSWSNVITLFKSWGINTNEFSYFNDGKIISAKTCKLIADAIGEHKKELFNTDFEYLIEDEILWRTCGGYRQF